MAELNRRDLLAALETCAPALATHNIVPQMTCFWFRGDVLMTYNDQIAISMPLETEFKGAVPGNVLLNLIKSSQRKTVEFLPSKTELQVKAGRSHMKLAMMGPDSFIFDMPELRGKDAPLHGKLTDFAECVASVMRSIGSDTSIPEQLGVTLVPNGQSLSFYTTNAVTISCAFMALKQEMKSKRRVIVSTLFCKQLLALLKGATKTEFTLTSEHAMLVADGVTLFGKLVDCDKPYDFESVVDGYIKPAKKSWINVPKGLKHAVERAGIISDGSIDQHSSKFTIDGDLLTIHSVSDRGEVRDKLRFEGEHAAISVKAEPKLIRDGLDDADTIAFVDRCVVMRNKDKLYLVSASK